jgi:hypothetical protein
MSENKMSLWQLQDALARIEELGEDEINLDEVVGDIRNKIDNIKMFIDTINAEASKFKTYADEFAKKAKTLTRVSERLEWYVLSSLEAHGTTFELGNLWTAKIKESKYVNMTTDPTATDAIALCEYDVVKTSYSWDKKALKPLLESGQFEGKGKISVRKSLNFTVNKGVK